MYKLQTVFMFYKIVFFVISLSLSLTWKWEEPQQDAFQKLKQTLTKNTVLTHFDLSCPVGISCDASESGVAAVLFHRFIDKSERPIANVLKTLIDTYMR